MMSSFIGPTSVVFIHGIRLGRGRRRSRRRRQIRMTIAVGLLHLHVNGWRPSNEIFRMRMGGGPFLAVCRFDCTESSSSLKASSSLGNWLFCRPHHTATLMPDNREMLPLKLAALISIDAAGFLPFRLPHQKKKNS